MSNDPLSPNASILDILHFVASDNFHRIIEEFRSYKMHPETEPLTTQDMRIALATQLRRYELNKLADQVTNNQDPLNMKAIIPAVIDAMGMVHLIGIQRGKQQSQQQPTQLPWNTKR